MLQKLLLDGRVAVVTGGGGGLGRAISLALAEVGADIAVSDRNTDAGESTASEVLNLGKKAVFIPADVTISRDVDALMNSAISHWGKVDILVNCAGIVRGETGESTSVSNKPLWEMTDDEWRIGMDTNLTSAFYCSRAVSRHMADRRYGRIINISSGFGFRGLKNAYMYTAAKAGLIVLTMSLALTLAEYGIRVNSIAPGLFRTHGTRERYDSAARFIPMGRVGEPVEIGGLAVLLASDAADYINGETYIVDGGALAGGVAPIGYTPTI